MKKKNVSARIVGMKLRVSGKQNIDYFAVTNVETNGGISTKTIQKEKV